MSGKRERGESKAGGGEWMKQGEGSWRSGFWLCGRLRWAGTRGMWLCEPGYWAGRRHCRASVTRRHTTLPKEMPKRATRALLERGYTPSTKRWNDTARTGTSPHSSNCTDARLTQPLKDLKIFDRRSRVGMYLLGPQGCRLTPLRGNETRELHQQGAAATRRRRSGDGPKMLPTPKKDGKPQIAP